MAPKRIKKNYKMLCAHLHILLNMLRFFNYWQLRLAVTCGWTVEHYWLILLIRKRKASCGN